jgi:hypothetical protein
MADYYIPRNDAKFDAWFNYLTDYVMPTIPAWPNIPKPEAEKPAVVCTGWHTAYKAVIGPHTPVDTETKNGAKKAAVKVIQAFANQYLRFLPVTARTAWRGEVGFGLTFTSKNEEDMKDSIDSNFKGKVPIKLAVGYRF